MSTQIEYVWSQGRLQALGGGEAYRRYRKLKVALAEAVEFLTILHEHKETFIGLAGKDEYSRKVKAARQSTWDRASAVLEHELLYGKPEKALSEPKDTT